MVHMLKVTFGELLQELKRDRTCCDIRTLGKLGLLSKSISEVLNTVLATRAKRSQGFHVRLPE